VTGVTSHPLHGREKNYITKNITSQATLASSVIPIMVILVIGLVRGTELTVTVNIFSSYS